ncbi:MAG: glycosyltransferase family 2 protein [Promethearchaeota archaeon]
MVYREKKIAITIPVYNEERLIIPTLRGIPDIVDKIIVVDDGSEDKTIKLISNFNNSKIHLIKLDKNQGVGHAIKIGYTESLKYDIDIVVVIGGDHQFDLEQLNLLLDPIIDNDADYTKGNRFLVDAKEKMPNKRYLGNIFLSILTRIASGVHTIFDTQDGFTAISKKVIETVDWDLFWDGYGYVSDFIIKLSAYGFRIKDIPRRAIYIDGENQSKIKISKYIKKVFPLIFKGYIWRLINQRKLRKHIKNKNINIKE